MQRSRPPILAATSQLTNLTVPGRGFRRLVKWRTGSEGRISYLKRRYGLDRTLFDGLTGARTWCGRGVLSHNSVKIAALVQARRTGTTGHLARRVVTGQVEHVPARPCVPGRQRPDHRTIHSSHSIPHDRPVPRSPSPIRHALTGLHNGGDRNGAGKGLGERGNGTITGSGRVEPGRAPRPFFGAK